MFAPGAQTPRPPGKAGRYESTLEGLRALQTSRKVFVSSLTPRVQRDAGRVYYRMVMVTPSEAPASSSSACVPPPVVEPPV